MPATAVTRAGLCLFFNTADAKHQLDAEIRCEDSILIGADGAALLKQSGVDRADDFRRRISWMASRNCYEDYRVYWQIDGSDTGDAPQKWTFEEWSRHWGPDHENSPGIGHVTKSKIELGVGGKDGWFDDIKVYNAYPAK